MELKRRDEPNGITVLTFAGEFGSVELPALAAGVEKLRDAGSVRLVFNLTDLRFINSAALGFLCELHANLPDSDGELVISEPSRDFVNIISTLGIDQLLTVCDSDEEALAQLGSGS